MDMKKKIAVGLTAGLLLLGNISVAQATTLSITNVDGDWANQNPASIVVQNDIGVGGNLSTARWGTGSWPSYQQSGYDFETDTTPFDVQSDGSMFSLGTFSHLNYPITGTTLDSIDLLLSLNIAGVVTSVTATFSIDHEETSNSGPHPDDIVTIMNPIVNEFFTVDGKEYYFNLFGFSQDYGQPLSTVFNPKEGKLNEATLYARITEAPINEVPEPATMLLFGTGLAGVAAFSRKKVLK
jgi:hypothetical protein